MSWLRRKILVWIVRHWSDRDLDQWDKLQIRSRRYGPVYVTISRAVFSPEDFEVAD